MEMNLVPQNCTFAQDDALEDLGMMSQQFTPDQQSLYAKEMTPKNLSIEDSGNVSRYKDIHVIMICWENDSLGVWKELAHLKEVFEYSYQYRVEMVRLPSQRSEEVIEGLLQKYIKLYDGQDNLLIFYYGGHGEWANNESFKIAPGDLTQIRRRVREQKLDWRVIQNGLRLIAADVLTIIDACDSISALSTIEEGEYEGRKEIITASGFPQNATGVHEQSFTSKLINELYWRSYLPRMSTTASIYKGAVQQITDDNRMKRLVLGPRYCDKCHGVPSSFFTPQPLHILLVESLTLGGILLGKFDKKRAAAQREPGFSNMVPKTWKTPNLFKGPTEYTGPKDFGYIHGICMPSPTQSSDYLKTRETARPSKTLKYGKAKHRSGGHHTTS